MFSKYYFLLFAMLLLTPVQTVSAQKLQGYIITNQLDTLYGTIKIPSPMFEHMAYFQVNFWDKNNNKRIYSPDELIAYHVSGNHFVSNSINKSGTNRKFLKLLQNGYCTLYEYKYLGTTYGVPGGVSGSSYAKLAHYAQKKGGDLHELIFRKLKNGKDLYFVDNGQLTFDIKTGKYKKHQLQDIVSRYNIEMKR